MIDLKLGSWLRRACSLAICLSFWQMATTLKLDFGVVTFSNVPLPADVASAALEFFHSPRLFFIGVGCVLPSHHRDDRTGIDEHYSSL
ncbi:hypothetical protein [Mesorhizobium sp. M1A.F.Ca.ET.072.01.1.1]|uniref:hypothetical protein n=1 Tax=Mesorhizobium sp. M1A.F.Ca.ET.072.01.1.1 TaxID=2496753 RepID=UPI00167AFE34|nr:hypothetical protein [Mesorhizobium sp. M1A.F.Ca.ET.072.01.1.1]